MRRWGLTITVFYALIVAFLLFPLTVYLNADVGGWSDSFRTAIHAYGKWLAWLCVAGPVIGEALLLFLRVDRSQKRLKPRTHILVSSITVALYLGLLMFLGVLDIGVALRGDKFVPDDTIVATGIGLAWTLWTIVFYRMNRNSGDIVSKGVSWLLRGSVLELLIAIPAHVIVRRRQDCSAPIATSFGITTGIAVMLLAFGPGILLLYKHRLKQYSMKASAGKSG